MARRKLVELPNVHRANWQDVLEEFILSEEAEGKCERTIHDYRFHVERFFKHCQSVFWLEAGKRRRPGKAYLP